MKILLLFPVILLGSCILMPKSDESKIVAIATDDSAIVNSKLDKLRAVVLGADSAEYRFAAAKLVLAVLYTQKDTSSIIMKFHIDTTGYFAGYNKLSQILAEDTSVANFYKDLLQLRNQYPALVSGKYKLYDIDNPFTCGFIKADNKDSILIIFNFNEDNQGFRGHFSFPTMTLLLSNYEDGPLPPINTSIALRPFEIRISKL